MMLSYTECTQPSLNPFTGISFAMMNYEMVCFAWLLLIFVHAPIYKPFNVDVAQMNFSFLASGIIKNFFPSRVHPLIGMHLYIILWNGWSC